MKQKQKINSLEPLTNVLKENTKKSEINLDLSNYGKLNYNKKPIISLVKFIENINLLGGKNNDWQ